jgi:hypothetical protein
VKRKKLILGCLAFVILVAISVWQFAPSTWMQISVTFVGYTNDVTGISLFGYATSNVSHAGFAVFRAHNSTRSTFSCYVGPILMHRAGAAEGESIELQGTLHTASSRGIPIAGHDFKLSPVTTVTFAVPAPDLHGKWQCGLSLTHIRNYKYHWQYATVAFAQRCGFHFGEKGQFAWSEEIVR